MIPARLLHTLLQTRHLKRLAAHAIVRLEHAHLTAGEHAGCDARRRPQPYVLADIWPLAVRAASRPADERTARALKDRIGLMPLTTIVNYRCADSMHVSVEKNSVYDVD